MVKEKLNFSNEDKIKIGNMLSKDGLSNDEINEILNCEYSSFDSHDEMEMLFGKGNYQNILEKLSNGYKMEELPKLNVNEKEIQEFNSMLEKNNITVENAKAIHQYTDGSNMILGIKRGEDRTKIQEGIIEQLSKSLNERGISQEKIKEVQEFVKGLDYERPVYENYEKINDYSIQGNLPNACKASINKSVQSMDRFNHIDETVAELDDALSKTQLINSMKVYRAVKGNSLKELYQVEDLSELKGKSLQNKGQTSTSPLYDSSFAKYDTYDAVFEIFAPRGSKGSYITQLSDYGKAEQEVLMNPNDLYITDVSEIVDKNGKNKTILKALMLSKEKECYKGIDKTSEPNIELQEQNQRGEVLQNNIDNTNLPMKQSRFSKFYNQIRAKFSKYNERKMNKKEAKKQNKNEKEDIEKSQPKEKKSWELEPEEKERIQKNTAQIAKRHRENMEKAKEEKQNTNEVAEGYKTQEENQQIFNQQQIQQQQMQQPIADFGGMEL